MRNSAHAQQRPESLDDERLLRELGIKQTLHRRMNTSGSTYAGVGTISIMSGTLLLFGFGLNSGGPSVVLWGWLAIGPLVLCLAAALAEIASRFPSSGGLYLMAKNLGGDRWGWYTGWLNLLGLLAGIAAQDYGIGTFAAAWANWQWGITLSPRALMALCGVILLLHALMNLFSANLMNTLNSVSAGWHLLGAVVIIGALVFIPSHHQSTAFAFGEFTNNTGWANQVYVVSLGMLLPCFALAGYDTPVHLAEETKNASVATPLGVVRSVAICWIAGGILLAAMIFAIQDPAATLSSPNGPVPQILHDALGMATAKILLLVIIGAQFLCGYTVTTSASRMIMAFSRGGALPGSARWEKTSRRDIPAHAVWLAVTVAFVLALPALFSPTAFAAITAISVVGFTSAYAIPVLLRLIHPDKWTPGTWSLGRWSKPIGWTAVAWAAGVTVMFMLPQTSPITVSTFNYTPIATAVAFGLAAVWWRFGRGSYLARHSGQEAVRVDEDEFEGII
ncbi:amino acid permease [Streptomyces sp. NPDC057654]|uniref:amino acid permease n=1 Tax=Streptomyces sp. NPDC057654 TaxID=3346196 RepID=UPI0036A0AADB